MARSRRNFFACWRALVWAKRQDSVPVWMMVPLKESRWTMAAQGRGSVKVLVQPPNDLFKAVATLSFSSRSVRTWTSISALRRSSLRWPSSSKFPACCGAARSGERPAASWASG